MGAKWDKFLLLMWKNWILQYRKPIQTLVEIISPVVLSILLVVIRSLVDPELHESVIYEPFCAIPLPGLCPNVDTSNGTSIGRGLSRRSAFPTSNYTLVYSPSKGAFDEPMNVLKMYFNVIGLEDSHQMESFFAANSTNTTFAGIQFDDSYKGIQNLNDKALENLKISIRFPGETRLSLDPFGINTWRTNLIFPVFQVPGPREPNATTGGAPSYYQEGFLGIQHLLTMTLILVKNNFTSDISDYPRILSWMIENKFPVIYMRRFPHSEWYNDLLLTPLTSMLGIIIMLSFVYTCINTVKTITTEKEKQLKEAMKIMGLPNWLHWCAWFLKCFIFLFISVVLMVVLLKVKWYTNTDYTVFTHANPGVMLLFLVFYVCCTITFCFALSVFFSKANTAATIAGLVWFLSHCPFMFLQEKYDTLTLSTKLLASLGGNSAMAFGFQIMLMYEGTGEGIQWNNIFTPTSPDDSLTLGHILVMLAFDAIIYLLIALYVEAIFPGEYGVPQPWNFPFTSTFWCGQPRYTGVEDQNNDQSIVNEGEYFETEPKHLQPGIQVRNLRKVFGSNVAVRNFSINMYKDQITVLLGHNGAGKTTTMSMLTGMITPTSGTAQINGYDIRTNMEDVRASLGLCPQHNIIFDELTVAEHLYFFSKLKGLSKDEIAAEIDKYVDLLELGDKRNAKSSTLSGGMKRKLSVGMALCGNSKVVMLDEPTAGMDPSARRALWNLLQTQKEDRTMLLTTHFMDEADLLGDRIAIMAGGELQCCGSSFFLKKKYGAGYSLIMDKSKQCNVEQVTQLLKKYIPDIEIHSNVGSELSYLLVENQSSVFEPMLQNLENESERIGIRSYGISLTTLEEVFMKVGADHGQEEYYNDIGNGVVDHSSMKNGEQIKKDHKEVNMAPSFTTGLGLVCNQFLAMLMKKVVSIVRSWILLLIQIVMPTLFLIIAMVVSRNQKRTGNLPEMPLSLDKFDNPVILMENNSTAGYGPAYENVLHHLGYETRTENIMENLLSLTKSSPNTVRRRYIAGASFVENDTAMNITAWFNNDPYHTPGVALGLVLNSVYQKLVNCSDCIIQYTNHPLPYTAETQVRQILSGQTMGFQLAFNVCFSMAFVSSFYILFIVREHVSKSKHLQFVSGVKVYIFWLTTWLFDMMTYILTILILLVTLAVFQENGFRTVNDIGRMFLILFYFGWAFLPMIYISGYFFEIPSTGYTRMSLFSIFTGNAAFLVVQVLSTPNLDLEYVGNALHWVLLLIPHYSLATGISECYKVYAYNYMCNMIYDSCKELNIPKDQCYASPATQFCKELDDNYYKWEAPGIGRNLLYSFTVGAVLFVLLLFIEYELFSKFIYYVNQKFFPKYPVDVEDEDRDVAEEKENIRNTSEFENKSNYVLAIRDLTKYYKKFLAVNGLCLGVKKYECFGLLGVNGAGKTTTFKMMSGDVKISYGDGWVNGFSIKSELKQIQKCIGYCPQFDALLDNMTARETIVMFSLLRGIDLKRANMVADYLSREFDFSRHLDKQVRELSGGNKRKLSTAISLIGDPPVLYLDEPTTGMDPATKRYLWNALCKIRDNGKCIVLTSHSMEECEALCTRLAIMVNGNFKCLGSTQHLKNKFAEGYTLTIKIKKHSGSVCETEPVEGFIREHFPTAVLREKHQELLNYYVTEKSVPWSKMFGILEGAKRQDLNIEDYSLGQNSLEQVFLTFTKHQSNQDAIA